MAKIGYVSGFLILALAIIGGCGDTVDPQNETIKLGESFEIDLGQTVNVEDEELELKFHMVVEDARCLPFEFCEWPGYVSISLLVTGIQLQSTTVKLILFADADSITKDVCSVDVGDFNIRFENFGSYGLYMGKDARVSTPPEPPNPTATLKISRNFTRPAYDGNVRIGEHIPSLIDVDPFDLDSVWIDGDTLSVIITSGGGCTKHYGFLFMTPASFTATNPPQADLYIRHFSDSDPCDAVITQVLRFDISAIKRLYESIHGTRDPIQLNVFDYFVQTPGQSKSIMYEPEPRLIPAAVGNRWIYQSYLSGILQPDDDTLWPIVTRTDTISIQGTEIIDGKVWWKLSGGGVKEIFGFDRFRYEGDTVVALRLCGESVVTAREFVPLATGSTEFETFDCSGSTMIDIERHADSIAYIWCHDCADAGSTRIIIPGTGLVSCDVISLAGGSYSRLLEFSQQE